MLLKRFLTNLLNYGPSLLILVFSMAALHFSIVLIDDYKGAVPFEKHGDHAHVSLVDSENFTPPEGHAKRAQKNLYWAVIAVGLTGFVLVLLNSDKFRKLQKASAQKIKAQKEHEELQTQLYQAQKMEAIGRLAGGIAHDFNNILAAMNGYAEFLIEDLDEGSVQHKFAGNILQAGQQARDLVDQILEFSRHKEGTFAAVNLTEAVEESMSMLSASFPKTIELQTDIQPGLPSIRANSTQIAQLIMNLCVNARDAMEESHGVLKLGVTPAPPDMYAQIGIAQDGDAALIRIEETGANTTRLTLGGLERGQDYLCLSVSDTGTGMSRAIMEHIFEPFFTTKSVEKGTGLGLATIHGVVVAHKGAMVINSTIDLGTVFELFFPLADKADSEFHEEEPQRGVPATQASILIVEDQDHVREMMLNMMRRMGHEVSACSTGADALDFLRENIGKTNLVITDQNMPKMTGLEMIEQAAEDFSDLPFIVVSGYSEKKLEPFMEDNLAVKAVLKKPVSRQVLERSITEALGDGLEKT